MQAVMYAIHILENRYPVMFLSTFHYPYGSFLTAALKGLRMPRTAFVGMWHKVRWPRVSFLCSYRFCEHMACTLLMYKAFIVILSQPSLEQ